MISYSRYMPPVSYLVVTYHFGSRLRVLTRLFRWQHFQQMAAEDGLFSVSSTDGALLWLWRAHNKVNSRIAGDVTEDPLHPKRQFPDRTLCAECFHDDEYDSYEVLEFLLRFYAAENFRGQGLDPMPVSNLPSMAGHGSGNTASPGESGPTDQRRTPLLSEPQERDGGTSTSPLSGRGRPEHKSVVTAHAPAAPEVSPAGDQRGAGSVRSVLTARSPFLVRSSLPPPAVLPPQPGRPDVVPGIMRYPSEMAHVFPAVVRASPADGTEVTPDLESGRSRTQRRIAYASPRVVYSRPRVVYPRPRVVYSRRRQTVPLYSRHAVVHHAHDGAQHVHGSSGLVHHGGRLPVRTVHRPAKAVRIYWPADDY